MSNINLRPGIEALIQKHDKKIEEINKDHRRHLFYIMVLISMIFLSILIFSIRLEIYLKEIIDLLIHIAYG